MGTVISCVFFIFESSQIQNLQLTLLKENELILSFLAKKLPDENRLTFSKAYIMNERAKYQQANFDNFIILKIWKRPL